MKMSSKTLLFVLLGAFMGLAVGVGIYTFVYAKGGSYLTNNPSACANCHVMWPQYDGWIKSSHRSVAACNDCHTPSGFIPKYAVKAENGFWHSFYFTTDTYPDVIIARDVSRRITENACRRCHSDIAEDIAGPHAVSATRGEVSCIKCHREVGHPK
jgi:cytochrome c nitrite reductase small subunit